MLIVVVKFFFSILIGAQRLLFFHKFGTVSERTYPNAKSIQNSLKL